MTTTENNKWRVKSPGTRKVLTSVQTEKMYRGLLELHTIQGLSKKSCAQQLGVSEQTINYHFKKYMDWLKEQFPEDYDPEYRIKWFIRRREDAATRMRYDAIADDKITARDRAQILKLASDEDDRIVRLLQDSGVLEREAENHLPGEIKIVWGGDLTGNTDEEEQ